MVAFDATMLIDLFNVKLSGPRRLKLELLIKTLSERRQKIVVPAPAYSEFLVGAGLARDAYQARIAASSVFTVQPFDEAAALECALALGKAFSAGDQRKVTKTKFKFDWMIVATAKATPDVDAIYTADADIIRYAASVGMLAVHVDGLPLPQQGDWIEEVVIVPSAPEPAPPPTATRAPEAGSSP